MQLPDDITKTLFVNGILIINTLARSTSLYSCRVGGLNNTARRACDLVGTEGSLSAYFWRFEENDNAQPQSGSTSPIVQRVAQTPLEVRGLTTVYAFTQAMGLVNDQARSELLCS